MGSDPYLILGLMPTRLKRNNMERYVFVKDDESSHTFTDNRPYMFKVQLKLPLNFDGYW